MFAILISNKMATLNELQTIYSLEDVYAMYDIVYTDNYNQAMINYNVEKDRK